MRRALVFIAIGFMAAPAAAASKYNPITGNFYDLVGSTASSSGSSSVSLSSTNTWTAPQTFSSSVTVSASGGLGVTYGLSAGSATITGLTASLPVQTNASKMLTSAAINLSGSQVTGSLPAASIAPGSLGLSVIASSVTPSAIDGITATFTNKTYDASATGNVLKLYGYIALTHPHNVDGTNATFYTTVSSQPYYGQAQFSNSVSSETNFCEYTLTVPPDIDSSVEWRIEQAKVRLGGADTSSHTYVFSMSSIADSAGYGGAATSNGITANLANDASGASGDVETISSVTLTGWAAAMTPGQLLRIRWARDGDAANDVSAVNSFSGPLILRYGKTQ